jgi:hypothetical protein
MNVEIYRVSSCLVLLWSGVSDSEPIRQTDTANFPFLFSFLQDDVVMAYEVSWKENKKQQHNTMSELGYRIRCNKQLKIRLASNV